ncbi:MAG: hypothetical protein WD851_25535, partial [Pirellulales bacterium]
IPWTYGKRLGENFNGLLANDKRQVVEIDKNGWRVLNESPVMFRQEKGMLPLPVPQPGGSMDKLRPFVNVSDEQWPLLLGFLVAALHPRGPYPVLAVSGEQGSAKSALCRCLRNIIDPNTAALRRPSRDERGLFITANNSWMPVFDNLSHLPNEMSDAICTLSTGGGLATRTHYSDDEETIFNLKRPTILSGIEDVARRSDLLQRCIILNLPRIDESMRRPESELDEEFETARPFILGALLNAVSTAIRNLPHVHLPSPPRMADMALWVMAAESGLGLSPGSFINAYRANQDEAAAIALESSPVARVLIQFAISTGKWEGTASELKPLLDSMADEQTRRSTSWPKLPAKLGGDIKRLTPELRKLGITIEQARAGGKGRTRVIRIECHAPAISEMAIPGFGAYPPLAGPNVFPATAGFTAPAPGCVPYFQNGAAA